MITYLRERAWAKLLLLFVVVALLPSEKKGLAAVNFSGTLSSAKSSDGAESLSQIYRVSTGTKVDLTEIMDLSGALSLSRQIVDESQSQRRISDSFSPSLSLGIRNEFFSSNLRGSVNGNRNSDGSANTTTALFVAISSAWSQKKYWPHLNMSLNKSRSSTSRAVDDFDSQDTSLGVVWNVKYANLRYSANHRESNYEHTGRSSLNNSQFGSLALNRSFWRQRCSLSLNQTFGVDTFEDILPGIGGELYLRDRLIDVNAGSDPDGTKLKSELGVLPAALPSYPPDSDTALTVVADFRDANLIYITITVDEAGGFSMNPFTLPANIAWDIYSSGNGNLGWDFRQSINDTKWLASTSLLVPEDLLALYKQNKITYVAEQHFFVVYQEALTGLDLKLVAKVRGAITTPAGGEVSFDRVEVDRLVQAATAFTQEQETSKASSNASLSLRLTDSVSANATYSLFVNQISGVNDRETQRLNYSGGLSWNPRRKFSASLTANQGITEEDGVENTNNRSYGLSVFATPIPTLSVNLTSTLAQSFDEQGELKSTGLDHNGRFSAAVFHDLDVALGINYSTNESFGLRPLTGEAWGGDINVTARLTSRMNANLKSNYYGSSGGEDSFSAAANWNWRPTDDLSFYLNGNLGRDKQVDITFNTSAVLTNTIQMYGNYMYRGGGGNAESHGLGYILNWNLNEKFNLSTRGQYHDITSDNRRWFVGIDLNMRLN